MSQRSTIQKFKRPLLYATLAVGLLAFGCEEHEVDTTAPIVKDIRERPINFDVTHGGYRVSVLNDNASMVEIGPDTKLKVWTNTPELRFWHENDNSSIFIFATPNVPECWAPRAYGNSSGAWRVTYGYDPLEFPFNSRVEGRDTWNGWQISGIGNTRHLWLKVEKWDPLLHEYIAPSPWFEIKFESRPVDDPPNFKEL